MLWLLVVHQKLCSLCFWGSHQIASSCLQGQVNCYCQTMQNVYRGILSFQVWNDYFLNFILKGNWTENCTWLQSGREDPGNDMSNRVPMPRAPGTKHLIWDAKAHEGASQQCQRSLLPARTTCPKGQGAHSTCDLFIYDTWNTHFFPALQEPALFSVP